jgi:hypothetical protein
MAARKSASATDTLAADPGVIASSAFAPRRYELRRDGQAPLSFDGQLMAQAVSYAPGPRIWYEIGVYAAEKGYVLSTRAFKKGINEKDLFRADRYATLEALINAVEVHDASHDVIVHDDLTDASLSAAEAMVKAAALRQRMDEARREYRAASGDLLTDLATLQG